MRNSASSRVFRWRSLIAIGCSTKVSEKMKIQYSEGSVFRLPLTDSGYARGVIARLASRGRAPFGYFFGPRLSLQDPVKVEDLRPENAISRLMFGELGLLNGEWMLHGKVPNWNRTEWPMPDFVIRDPLGFRKPSWCAIRIRTRHVSRRNMRSTTTAVCRPNPRMDMAQSRSN
jgi:hypothetical protein